MIRHPRTLGRLGHARSAAFMRRQLRDPEVRRKALARLPRSAASACSSARSSCPRCSAPTSSSSPTRSRGSRPTGVATATGEHEVDCVIYGTGFKADGLHAPDADHRPRRDAARGVDAGPHAHLGITVPGFPSLFLMYGPNTNTSGGSIIVYLEAQAGYIAPGAGARPRPRGGGDRRPARGRGRERPRAPGALRRHRVDALRLLVPRRARPDRHQLAGLHARVRGVHARARSRPVHVRCGRRTCRRASRTTLVPSEGDGSRRGRRTADRQRARSVAGRGGRRSRTPRIHSTPCSSSDERDVPVVARAQARAAGSPRRPTWPRGRSRCPCSVTRDRAEGPARRAR